MPYYISDTQSDCSGWATIKADTPEATPETIGCHQVKDDAIDQMVAVSLSEDVEPMGDWATRNIYMSYAPMTDDEDEDEERVLPDNYRPALADDVPEGRACGNCVFYEESNENDDGTKAYCTKWKDYVDGAYYCNAWQPYEEERQINLNPPQFMRDNAKRGLVYHAEGLSGDGLMPQTVEDARKMAAGEITIDKWRKIPAWIARHMVDLEAADDEITAGVVAHLLWGSGSTKAEAQRTMDYAQKVVDQLDKELDAEERAEAPASDQIFGSDKNPEGSASDATNNITLDDKTETALATKTSEHNAKMKEESKPDWTSVTNGKLRAVWRRGAGAFSTSHRPNMTRAQWAMARVNAFLYLSANGKPQNEKYITDNDLLNTGHPKYSKNERDTEMETEEIIIDDERSATPVVENRWVAIDKGTRSIAFTNLELRAMADGEDDWTVRGYAAVFDSPSEPLPFTEYVKRGAFKKTIKDRSDVRLLIDHTGVPLARTKSGTLILTEDDKGLFMEASLDPANPDAVKIRSALKRGDLSQMSFAFETIKDSWNAERTVRELKEVRLHDVSIVTYPAYEETSAEMRNKQISDTSVAIVQTVSLRKAQVLLAKTRAVN